MKVILGTYRGPALYNRALDSLNDYLRGWDELTVVDDSGNEEWVDLYRRAALEAPIPTKVLSLPQMGYNAAMKAICAEAGNERFLLWEEDFVLNKPVDLELLGEVLDAFPALAQLVLQRQPWFPNEVAAGSVIAGLVERVASDVQLSGYSFGWNGDLLPMWSQLEFFNQVGSFSCNPGVWQTGVAADGWPDGAWSEDRKRDELLERGYRFGLTVDQFVTHDGVRSGHGY